MARHSAVFHQCLRCARIFRCGQSTSVGAEGLSARFSDIAYGYAQRRHRYRQSGNAELAEERRADQLMARSRNEAPIGLSVLDRLIDEDLRIPEKLLTRSE